MTARPTRPARATPRPAAPAGRVAPDDGWWEEPLSLPPRKGYVYERSDREGALHVREWQPEKGAWRKASLKGSLFDDLDRRLTGRALAERKQWARVEARRILQQWDAAASGEPESAAAARARRLTLGETRAVITAPDTGKYPADSHHRREVLRALDYAVSVWGPDREWSGIGKADLRQLGRRRVEQLRAAEEAGYRGAEITVARVLAIAAWLRDEGLIDERACLAPTHWKRELHAFWQEKAGGRAYVPERPRYTLEESRAVLAAAPAIDPRLGLLLAVGAELRAGQVERCRRTDLACDEAGRPWRLTVPGRGKKGGAVVEFTDGQRAVVAAALGSGYLRHLEVAFRAGAIADYLLFPSGQLRGGRKGEDPVAVVATHRVDRQLAKRTLLDWFHLAETRAKVTPVPGGAFYRLRRAAVDFALAADVSRHGLMSLGGWADTQVPERIYADQEAVLHRGEATTLRGAFRGEVAAAPPAEPAAEPAPPTPSPTSEPA